MPEQLRRAVGPGKPNDRLDVRLIQRLLDRSTAMVGSMVPTTGVFDRETESAIFTYQRRVFRRPFPTGVISPGDETFWRLSETRPRRLLAGARGGIILAPVTGEMVLRDEDYLDAAKSLECEVRAIKAVAMNETKGGAFDERGRPVILFERHYFSRLTLRRYDGHYPTISRLESGGYSFPESDQWVRLQQAYALNPDAALKSTSWGIFQIMGINHAGAGFGTVEQFAVAMCQSARQQLDAFIEFIKADPHLLTSIRDKDWAAIARFFNGPGYADNHYDARLADNYSKATR